MIEMWRPGAESWALRGRLTLVANTAINGRRPRIGPQTTRPSAIQGEMPPGTGRRRNLLLTSFAAQRMTDPLDTPGALKDRELDLAKVRVPSRRRRSTTHINKEQTENLIAALAFADAEGLPLNTSVDINWGMCAGFTDDRTRIAHLQERLQKWCRRNEFPLTMIWVQNSFRLHHFCKTLWKMSDSRLSSIRPPN